MAATDATPLPRKNTAYRVTFPIWDADGDLVTGATGLDSEVSKDGGTFADCTNEATEIATASGMYYLDLTSTEMNADTVAIIVKTSSSGAKTTPIVLYPQETGDVRVNVTAWNGTAVPSEHTAGYPIVTVKDGTGTGEIDTTSGGVLVAALANDAITAAAIATDAIGSAELAATAGSEIASAVRTELTTELGRIDAAVSTRLASAGYTAPPSAATIAAAVWDYLTSAATTVGSLGKLLVDNINATISSRLASASYTAPLDAAGVRSAVGLASANLDTQLDALPTAAENASQVRTELTTELSRVDAAVSTRATPAQVNAEVVDALATDTYAEPGQGAPPATTTLAAKINYLYKAWRNKKAQSSSVFSLYADDASTVDQKAAVSDDGTTTTVGEIASGP